MTSTLLQDVADAILENHGLATPGPTRDLAMPLALKHARAAILKVLDNLAEPTREMMADTVEATRNLHHDMVTEPIYRAAIAAKRSEIELELGSGE